MNLNCVTKQRRMSQLSSIICVVSLLLMVSTSIIYYVLLHHHPTIFYQQGLQPLMNLMVGNRSIGSLLCANKNNTLQQTTTDDLMGAKKLVEEKRKLCEDEKKGANISLEAVKEIHRQTTATLNEQLKVCEQGMKQALNQTEHIRNQCQNERKIHSKSNSASSAAAGLDRKLFDYMATYLHGTSYPGVENYTRYSVARLGMLKLAGIKPLKPEYGPVINNVTSFHYPISVPACLNASTATKPSLFVTVNSAPGNFDKRKMIRQTWLNHLKEESKNGSFSLVGFAFILGMTDNIETQSKIQEESQTHGDIIQIGMSDFYRNLSLKVAGLFNWLYSNCPNIDFLYKVDDDVYVNVRNLAQFVVQHRSNKSSMFGSYYGYGSDYIPNREGKWSITLEEWPWNLYPRYFNGQAVAISGSSILPLLAAFQTTPMMPFDDVYYIGICTERNGVTLQFASALTSFYSMPHSDLSTPCRLRQFIAWIITTSDGMNNSHVATDDFYANRTQCIVTNSNGTNTTIDHTHAPVEFSFVSFSYT